MDGVLDCCWNSTAIGLVPLSSFLGSAVGSALGSACDCRGLLGLGAA